MQLCLSTAQCLLVHERTHPTHAYGQQLSLSVFGVWNIGSQMSAYPDIHQQMMTWSLIIKSEFPTLGHSPKASVLQPCSVPAQVPVSASRWDFESVLPPVFSGAEWCPHLPLRWSLAHSYKAHAVPHSLQDPQSSCNETHTGTSSLLGL